MRPSPTHRALIRIVRPSRSHPSRISAHRVPIAAHRAPIRRASCAHRAPIRRASAHIVCLSPTLRGCIAQPVGAIQPALTAHLPTSDCLRGDLVHRSPAHRVGRGNPSSLVSRPMDSTRRRAYLQWRVADQKNLSLTYSVPSKEGAARSAWRRVFSCAGCGVSPRRRGRRCGSAVRRAARAHVRRGARLARGGGSCCAVVGVRVRRRALLVCADRGRRAALARHRSAR